MISCLFRCHMLRHRIVYFSVITCYDFHIFVFKFFIFTWNQYHDMLKSIEVTMRKTYRRNSMSIIKTNQVISLHSLQIKIKRIYEFVDVTYSISGGKINEGSRIKDRVGRDRIWNKINVRFFLNSRLIDGDTTWTSGQSPTSRKWIMSWQNSSRGISHTTAESNKKRNKVRSTERSKKWEDDFATLLKLRSGT